MPHANAPLSVEGRRRLVRRVLGLDIGRSRPISHVAAEAHLSRATVTKWVRRYQAHGEAGLVDVSSRPRHQPTASPAEVVNQVLHLRRVRKLPPRLIVVELAGDGVTVSATTAWRICHRAGVSRLRDLDVTGNSHRVGPGTRSPKPQVITAEQPGSMVHVDVKKVGAIPTGGGWRVHGRGSVQHRATRRQRAGYVYWHTALDGHSRLAYTEALPDETAATAIGFWARAVAFFAAHGITRIHQVITDNGACYRSRHFRAALRRADPRTRHTFCRPYRPQPNGKVERYHRIIAAEFAYARVWTSETERGNWLGRWLIHYNYHRPHTALGNQPPATAVRRRVTNVMVQNS